MRKTLDTSVYHPSFEALEPRLMLAADPAGAGLEGIVGLSALDAVTMEAGESYDPQDARGSRLLSFIDEQHQSMTRHMTGKELAALELQIPTRKNSLLVRYARRGEM